MALVSVRECAKVLGVSHTILNRQIKAGRIPTTGGKVDPEVVRRARAENCDGLQRQRGAKPKPAAEQPPPLAERQGSDPDTKPASNSKAEAERQREWLRVKQEEIKLAKEEGRYIDAREAAIEYESRATADKEALLNWPAGVAIEMAAELGVSDRELQRCLDKHIRIYLDQRSSVSAE